MKMTNSEMIKNYNGLNYIQELEDAHFRRTGEKLFKGRVNITYGIKKNMGEFAQKLNPYNDALDEVFAEYRDQDTEKKSVEALKKKIVKSPEGTATHEKEMKEFNRKACALPIVMKEGKDRKEYDGKIQELLDIEVDDVSIHKIKIEQLEGIELDSNQIEPLMFMIAE